MQRSFPYTSARGPGSTRRGSVKTLRTPEAQGRARVGSRKRGARCLCGGASRLAPSVVAGNLRGCWCHELPKAVRVSQLSPVRGGPTPRPSQHCPPGDRDRRLARLSRVSVVRQSAGRRLADAGWPHPVTQGAPVLPRATPRHAAGWFNVVSWGSSRSQRAGPNARTPFTPRPALC